MWSLVGPGAAREVTVLGALPFLDENMICPQFSRSRRAGYRAPAEKHATELAHVEEQEWSQFSQQEKCRCIIVHI